MTATVAAVAWTLNTNARLENNLFNFIRSSLKNYCPNGERGPHTNSTLELALSSSFIWVKPFFQK